MNNWIDKLEGLTEVLGAEAVLEEMCRVIGAIETDKILTYIMNLWGIEEEDEEEDEE